MAKQTKEVAGVKVTIDPDVFNDWDVIVLMSRIGGAADGGDDAPSLYSQVADMDKLLTIIYGEQLDGIKDHIREDNGGFVPAAAIADFLNATMEAFNLKN